MNPNSIIRAARRARACARLLSCPQSGRRRTADSSPAVTASGGCTSRGTVSRGRGVFAAACAVALTWLAPAGITPASAAEGDTGVIVGRVQSVLGGRNLENARITVQGTGREVFTNAAGEYRITGVPAGEVQIEAFFTGHDRETATVQVQPGGTARHDFILRALGRAADEGVVLMDTFVVASEREYNAQAIAINEQRVAANLKNVVSTDAFGEINQGNIGEFLKHVPGVTIEVKDGNTPSGVQVRGFNSNYTNVTIDGGTIASTALANTQFHSRQFVLEQANINNLARIEVVKLPLPDMPANSLGGSVNFVTKSAFEFERPQLQFKTYLTANSEALSFSKRPGAGRGEERTILPSGDLTWSVPVNDQFGYVLSFASSNQFFFTDQSVPLHRWTEEGATVENPMTHEFRWSTGANRTERTSGSFKIDWKPGEGHLLEFSGQANAFKQETSNRQLTLRVGDEPVEWGETFTHGAEDAGGGGSIGASGQVRHGLTRALAANYTFERNDWKFELGANYSSSTNLARDHEKGFFSGIRTELANVSRVDFDDIDNSIGSVGEVTIVGTEGELIDFTKLASYDMTRVSGQHWEAEDELWDLRASVSRDFDIGNTPVTLEAGFAQNRLRRAIDYTPMEWDYLGPDGILESGDESLEQFIDPDYSGLSPGHGMPPQEWVSPWLVYEAFQENPSWFDRAPKYVGDTIRNNAIRSPLVRETITAGYLMADVQLMENRLRIAGGVRYELTENSGWGPRQDNDAIYQRDANGDLILDGEGNPIRLPEAGEEDSGEEAALIYHYREQYNERDYDGLYPSLAITYDITDSLLLRLGYARTIGRPRTVDIVPYVAVTTNVEFDPGEAGSAPGWVESSNTELEPWQAHNYDLSLEYYLPGNGLLSAGVFFKDISDFFGELNLTVDEALIEELGLTENELGYEYQTRINAGDAEIKGLELNYQQPLDYLGEWGRHFWFMANYTRLNLSGSNEADFEDFIPTAGNIGLRFNLGRFSAFVKWNYRGRQLRELKDDFPDAAEYIRPRQQWDANIEYQLNDHLALFLAGRNITNETNEWEVAGPVAPSWSFMQSHTRFGAQYSLGIKGSF